MTVMEPMKTHSKKLLLNALKTDMNDNDQDKSNWKPPVKKKDSLTHFSQNFNVLHLGPSDSTKEELADSDLRTAKNCPTSKSLPKPIYQVFTRKIII